MNKEEGVMKRTDFSNLLHELSTEKDRRLRVALISEAMGVFDKATSQTAFHAASTPEAAGRWRDTHEALLNSIDRLVREEQDTSNTAWHAVGTIARILLCELAPMSAPPSGEQAASPESKE